MANEGMFGLLSLRGFLKSQRISRKSWWYCECIRKKETGC